MAFMGMVLGAIFIVILLCIAGLVLLFFTTAIILKIIGKVKDNKKVKRVGTVFIVLGSVFAVPLVLIGGYAWFVTAFVKVDLPNGRTAYELNSNYNKVIRYADNGDDESLRELGKLLKKHPNLVYVRDNNYRSILEYGIKNGNSGLVRLAIDNGAVFDDPAIYDHMAYVKTSMEDFVDSLYERQITPEDVEIIKMMFEEDASTDLYDPHGHPPYYSNMFGKAVWAVLYNDGDNGLRVTDTEMEFIQVFIDNDIDSDYSLMFVEDVPSNYMFSDSYYGPMEKDANYEELVRIAALVNR